MRHTQGQDAGKGVILATPSKPLLLKKGRWSPEEDNKLINYMMKNGNAGGWSYVARQAGLQRCGNSCRLRWINYLRPGLKRGAFSYQEEMLIIHLQSILGNRWCLIAKQLPGRTDNELKNHWNSHIKKQLQLKLHRLPSSFTTDTNAKTNRPSEWDHKCNTNSVSAHSHDAFTSSHSSQQYLDVIPEGSQPPNNAFTVLTTGENRLCVPGVLDLKHQLLQDQSDNEFSLDPNPTNNQQISCPQLDWTSATSNHTHNSFSSHAALMSPSVKAQSQHARSSTCDELIIESRRTTVEPHEAPRSADYCLGSTRITIPALVESNSLKEKIKNDENYIMMDYSNVSGPTHPYPDSADCSYVVDPGDYSTHEVGIDILKENESLYENATHQSCPTLDSRCQFRWPAGQFSDYIQSDNDRRDRPNFSYDVNLGFPAYIDISCRFKSYQLPHIEEEINANPIPDNTLMGRQEGNGLFETECNGEAGQVRDWAQDDTYNINPAAPSDLQQILLICNKSTTNL